ncbi:unnamed protein product [Musa textilis]
MGTAAKPDTAPRPRHRPPAAAAGSFTSSTATANPLRTARSSAVASSPTAKPSLPPLPPQPLPSLSSPPWTSATGIPNTISRRRRSRPQFLLPIAASPRSPATSSTPSAATAAGAPPSSPTSASSAASPRTSSPRSSVPAPSSTRPSPPASFTGPESRRASATPSPPTTPLPTPLTMLPAPRPLTSSRTSCWPRGNPPPRSSSRSSSGCTPMLDAASGSFTSTGRCGANLASSLAFSFTIEYWMLWFGLGISISPFPCTMTSGPTGSRRRPSPSRSLPRGSAVQGGQMISSKFWNECGKNCAGQMFLRTQR